MTTGQKKNRHLVAKWSFGSFFFCFMSIFSLTMILKNSEIAIEYMQIGLRLCAVSVIPSLFPFMVVSELLVACGFGKFLGRYLGKPFRSLFGISPAGSSAVLLGAVCGFPIGAKTAVSLYDRGMISRDETEKLLTFCNIPSSGFLISAVGVSLFSNRQFGIFLYLSALISSLLIGVLGKRRRTMGSTDLPASPFLSEVLSVSTFTSAVSSATASMLSVCSYVVFFSSIIGCLSHLLRGPSIPDFLEALLFGVFEISSGVSAASILTDPAVGAVICGFIIGWSGISVHFQILSLCGNRGISFFPYFVSKLFQGILCGVAAWVYVKLASPRLFSGAQSTWLSHPSSMSEQYTLVICLLFLFCIILRYGRKKFSLQIR